MFEQAPATQAADLFGYVFFRMMFDDHDSAFVEQCRIMSEFVNDDRVVRFIRRIKVSDISTGRMIAAGKIVGFEAEDLGL